MKRGKEKKKGTESPRLGSESKLKILIKRPLSSFFLVPILIWFVFRIIMNIWPKTSNHRGKKKKKSRNRKTDAVHNSERTKNRTVLRDIPGRNWPFFWLVGYVSTRICGKISAHPSFFFALICISRYFFVAFFHEPHFIRNRTVFNSFSFDRLILFSWWP